MTYPAIIVGTDGSSTAERAVRRAAVIAAAVGAPLIVATAYVRPRPEDVTAVGALHDPAAAANAYRVAVDAAQDGAGIARAAAPGLDVDVATPEGHPADALLDLGAQRPGSLVVVGSLGMTGSAVLLLGNVPNKVTHHAVGDVYIARTDVTGSRRPPQRLLVGTDGSATASRAVDRAVELTRALGGRLTVLSVGPAARVRPVLEDARQRTVAAGVACDVVQREGDPATVLVQEAVAHDVLVVGNKGMTGPSRFLLGSVPNKVSHHIGTDLLIVKTT